MPASVTLSEFYRHRAILISGASRGLGRALLTSLVDLGAGLIYALSSRQTNYPRSEHTEIIPIYLDISDFAAVEKTCDNLNAVDLLINNAAVNHFGTAIDAPLENIQQEITVNTIAPVHLTRCLTGNLRVAEDPRVVNIISICALAAMPGLAGYSASKAALWSLTQAMRTSLLPLGIQTHAVFPGPMKTDMNQGRNIPDVTAPERVAMTILQGVADNQPDIFPDPAAKQIHDDWRANPHSIEAAFSEYH